jgi:hypothetical protein
MGQLAEIVSKASEQAIKEKGSFTIALTGTLYSTLCRVQGSSTEFLQIRSLVLVTLDRTAPALPIGIVHNVHCITCIAHATQDRF